MKAAMHHPAQPARRRIGFVAYDGVVALDLIGPMDAFNAAGAFEAPPGQPEPRYYEVMVIAPSRRPITTDAGLVLQPHASFADAPPFDTLIIPGGARLRTKATQDLVVPWLREVAPRTRRVATVCTGIYALAAAGLLDGRRVATHWRFTRDLAEKFPALRVDPNALFVRDGSYYSSAGITAGIDLTLALIEEDCGPSVALAVARELVVYLKREGGQEQFSEPLKFQISATGRFADLAGWMVNHLDGDLSLDALAARACVSPRHFGRLFKETFGRTPAAHIEELRLGEARQRLTNGHATIDHIASSLGYASADVFRRAFERRFHLPPSLYRERFGPRFSLPAPEPARPRSTKKNPPRAHRETSARPT